jgi:hypothetical protein
VHRQEASVLQHQVAVSEAALEAHLLLQHRAALVAVQDSERQRLNHQ